MVTTVNFINKQTVSYTEYVEDITSWLQSLSDYSKWQDFFEGSDGTIIIEMIAAAKASEVYKILTTLQEAYLMYATKRSSAIANSQDKGYIVGRGTNLQITCTVVPSTTASFEKFSVVGTCGDYDLLLAEDTYFTKDESKQITCYIGILTSESIAATSDELSVFRFTNDNISDVCRLMLNEIEVPLGSKLLDLIYNKYVLVSNALGGVDALYLNSADNATYKYGNTDTLTLEYIEYADVSYTNTTLEFYYGDITSLDSQVNTIAQEQLNSIQLKAPLHAESSMVIAAREDFRKVLLQLYPALKDANSVDYSNPIVQVSYAMDNRGILSGTLYDSIYALLSKARVFGIPMCYIIPPQYMDIPLAVTLTMKSASSSFDANTYTSSIVNTYNYIMADAIDLSSIEDSLKDGESTIKTARVFFDPTTWTASTNIALGNVLKPTTDNDKIYIAKSFIFKSGTSEPTWPTTIDAIVIDNGVIWKCIHIPQNAVPMAWTAGVAYNLFDKVVPSLLGSYAYQMVGFVNYSNDVEPVWPTVQYTNVYDNQIIWMAIPKDITQPTWTADTIYDIGDTVNSVDNTDFSYQAIGYSRITGSVEPAWTTDASFIVDDVFFTVLDTDAQKFEIDWNNYSYMTSSVIMIGA